MSRVAIVGAGFVGSTAAFAMVARGVASDITLIDVNKEKAEGEAMDLKHGLPFVGGARIRFSGSLAACKGADLVVVTAGAHQKPGETRLDLVRTNAAIFRDMIPKVAKASPNAILLIVSNPLDVLTHYAWKLSGFPKSRVFGTGTLLDTARFRHLLGEWLGVDARSVHAHVLGEHGDASFPVWSTANIAGIPLSELPNYNAKAAAAIFGQTKRAAYEVIARKGATYYAIGLGVAHVAAAIFSDRNEVLPLSTVLDGYHGEKNVALSVPCVLGRNGKGIERTLTVPFNAVEKKAFHRSAETVRAALAGIR